MNTTIPTEEDIAAHDLATRHIHLKHIASRGLVVLEIAKRHIISMPFGLSSWDDVRDCFLRLSLPEGDPEFGMYFKRLGTNRVRTNELDLLYAIGMCLDDLSPEWAWSHGMSADKGVKDALMVDLFGDINYSSLERCKAVYLAMEERAVRVLSELTPEQRAAMGWGE
jgi:hypothetical protein